MAGHCDRDKVLAGSAVLRMGSRQGAHPAFFQ